VPEPTCDDKFVTYQDWASGAREPSVWRGARLSAVLTTVNGLEIYLVRDTASKLNTFTIEADEDTARALYAVLHHYFGDPDRTEQQTGEA
jgi:hypothetical protein